MVALYILMLCGLIMGLLFLVEAGISVYRIAQKQGRIRTHAILAVVFAAASIVCTSSAVFLVARKVISENTDYKEVLRGIARTSGEITAAAVEGFQDGFNVSGD
ncbi:MAG: hypothetical protein K2I74_06485 [Treponemataceae bacterium]|nr:hypothetical protein [Treponemataceae bacterium]